MSHVRLTSLADHLRKAGLEVVEVKGWKRRGAGFPAIPNTILCHHTATSNRAAGDMPSLRLLIEGRSDLPGPLSQLGLSRSGVVYVIASGKANHAGKGAWKGQSLSSGTIGIEAENDGSGKPWPVKQLDAYERLCAALCDYLGIPPERVCAHREWALPAGRKPDPAGIEMTAFRDRVRSHLESVSPIEDEDEDAMKFYVYTADGLDWGTDLVTRRPFEDQKVKADWIGLVQRLGHTVERITVSPAEAEALPAVGL